MSAINSLCVQGPAAACSAADCQALATAKPQHMAANAVSVRTIGLHAPAPFEVQGCCLSTTVNVDMPPDSFAGPHLALLAYMITVALSVIHKTMYLHVQLSLLACCCCSKSRLDARPCLPIRY
jgi:hypothetical protein